MQGRRGYLDAVLTTSLQEVILNHIGLSSSILEMLPSFEARNLRRASRSHAHTGCIAAGGGQRMTGSG